MNQDRTGKTRFSLPFSRVLLILAGLIALAAIAIGVLRSRSGGESVAPAATAPAGDVAGAIAGLERKLADNPRDVEGWAMLAWSYYNVGRYPDAARAYAHATDLEPRNPVYWSALGEVQILSGSGGVIPQAEASFRKALAIDPKDFRARYFLAVKKDADGDHKGALDDWIAVLRDSPPDAPWQQPVRDVIARVSAASRIDVSGRIPPPATGPATPLPAPTGGEKVATDGIPGPSPEQLKAASNLTPSQQDDMAKAMVARLAARLEADPRDADGWIRLMRARKVLGDNDAARAALKAARGAFADDHAQQGRFDDAARALGIPIS